MEQRPQLLHRVLDRSTSKEETVTAVEAKENLPPHTVGGMQGVNECTVYMYLYNTVFFARPFWHNYFFDVASRTFDVDSNSSQTTPTH